MVIATSTTQSVKKIKNDMTGMCLISLRVREKGNTKTHREGETEKADTVTETDRQSRPNKEALNCGKAIFRSVCISD